MQNKPWEVDSKLRPNYLVTLARLIMEIRHETLDLYDPDRGDGPWSLGCRIYDRTINMIERKAKESGFEWLKTEKPDLSFLMLIDGVPIKFFHGNADDPPARTLRIQYPEIKARQMLLFPEDNFDWLWRIAVETLDDGRVDRIIIFQINQQKDTRNDWEIDLHSSTTQTPVAPVTQVKPSVALRPDLAREGAADNEKK